jgi:hypothetical protein
MSGWGTRLETPSAGSADVLNLFTDAFVATNRYQHTQNNEDRLTARLARMAANITPPVGYIFAHEIAPGDTATLLVLNQGEAGKRTLERLPVDLEKWAGKLLAGNRICFDFPLPTPEEPVMARMTVSDYCGDQPRRGLHFPLGFLAAGFVGKPNTGIEILPADADSTAVYAVSPSEIIAAGMEQYGLVDLPPLGLDLTQTVPTSRRKE